VGTTATLGYAAIDGYLIYRRHNAGILVMSALSWAYGHQWAFGYQPERNLWDWKIRNLSGTDRDRCYIDIDGDGVVSGCDDDLGVNIDL
jgi:hypothetical protein